jgi:hypothetical protein
MQPLPALVQALGALWGFSATDTVVWWQALATSRWSTSAGLRQALVYYNQLGQSGPRECHVLEHICTPGAMMQCLEHLWKERRLTRQERVVLEDKLLRCVDAHGGWRLDRTRPSA